MNENLVCFSGNSNMQIAFKDYMNHFMSETRGVSGLTYDRSKSFADKDQKMNAVIRKEISRLSGIDMSDNSNISQVMLANHPNFKWASFAVINSLIDMVLPDILDKSVGIYSEQRFGKFGDSFSFEVKPNDLFYVSKAGRDQRTVEFQRQFNGMVTITPENREITVFVNFYRVLCGMDSIADFVMKAVLSLEANIARETYMAFDTAVSELLTTPVDGEMHLAGGFDQKTAVKLAQRVSAFNNGAPAVFVGTKSALSEIMPADANYRYTLDSEYVRMGYIRNAFGYDVIELNQIANWKDPYKLALNDSRIYVMSPSSQKIVKVCYEGDSYTTNLAAQTSANLTETTTINKSYGIGVATNAIVGVIDLE